MCYIDDQPIVNRYCLWIPSIIVCAMSPFIFLQYVGEISFICGGDQHPVSLDISSNFLCVYPANTVARDDFVSKSAEVYDCKSFRNYNFWVNLDTNYSTVDVETEEVHYNSDFAGGSKQLLDIYTLDIILASLGMLPIAYLFLLFFAACFPDFVTSCFRHHLVTRSISIIAVLVIDIWILVLISESNADQLDSGVWLRTTFSACEPNKSDKNVRLGYLVTQLVFCVLGVCAHIMDYLMFGLDGLRCKDQEVAPTEPTKASEAGVEVEVLHESAT
mmetsp:Transcript_7495/g.12591  ORF Transcript_7495/g.12591 Transcript_7495/m.12591 type:complete len:274 (-) Transcript_7495:199-1020(-)